MKDDLKIVDRRTLIAFACGALSASGVFIFIPDGSKPISQQELIAVIKQLNPPKSLVAHIKQTWLGKSNLLDELYENIQKKLKDIPSTRVAIEAQITEDYEANKVMVVDGWIMSRTEVALCLMANG